MVLIVQHSVMEKQVNFGQTRVDPYGGLSHVLGYVLSRPVLNAEIRAHKEALHARISCIDGLLMQPGVRPSFVHDHQFVFLASSDSYRQTVRA